MDVVFARMALASLLVLAACSSEVVGPGSGVDADADGSGGKADSGDDAPDPSEPPAHWRIVDGFDSAAIAEAFAAAGPGDTVYFPAGIYQLTEPLPLKSGVNLLGDPADPPLLEPAGADILVTRLAVANVAVRHLQLRNMRLYIEGADDYSAENIVIEDCRFYDGAVSNEWNGGYVVLHQVRGALIQRSTFERDRIEVGGRGVLLSRCHHCVVKDSFIGTNRDLDDGLGYFKTAINVYGYGSAVQRSIDTVVDDVVMRRQYGAPCQYPSESGNKCQDHGLYAWGNRDLQVTGSHVDGWEPTAWGNSLKLRNGELMFVEGNRFRDSGVMTFTYEREPAFTHFEQAIIRRNRFDLGDPDLSTSAASGMLYFRNFGAPATAGYEDDIHIYDNDFVSGGAVRISTARADQFCVSGNAGAELLVGNSSGTPRSTACTGGAWDRPLLGAFAGDFDENGHADVAHLYIDASGERSWMLHLRDGDGYRFEAWPASIYADPATEDYRAHVGDFDGDGYADDIAYWGKYGGDGTPSWRVHLSTGAGFEVAQFGTTLGASADTVTYGVHVGDFDGDGTDDLVYRGTCSGEPCWRVQRSTGDGFAAESWGNGLYAGADTATYGIQVGDFDGDGKDDLAYRGRCGGDGHPCWRVQTSTGTAFSAGRDFGDSAYLTSDSAHFGLHTGDLDGDGRTDLGYMAACGSGVRQWRYQVSTGSGFEVQCDEDYLF